MEDINEFPLLEIAISFIKEISYDIDNNMLKTLRKWFSDYINGKVDKKKISMLLLSTIHNTQPLEKIEKILNVSNDPLPLKQEDYRWATHRRKTKTWTFHEDIRLIAGIHRFGKDNWNVIAKFIGNGRTRAQCSQRWYRVLDPRISKDQWSLSDDRKLLQIVSTHGIKSWTNVAKEMGNRSDVQCRYHYNKILKDKTIPIIKPNKNSKIQKHTKSQLIFLHENENGKNLIEDIFF